MIAITHVDTALTRNLAFTQMGLACLDVILVIWANCAKQVGFLCIVHDIALQSLIFRLLYFSELNMKGFFVPGVKTALRHNCPVICSDNINGNNKRKLCSTNWQKFPPRNNSIS